MEELWISSKNRYAHRLISHFQKEILSNTKHPTCRNLWTRCYKYYNGFHVLRTYQVWYPITGSHLCVGSSPTSGKAEDLSQYDPIEQEIKPQLWTYALYGYIIHSYMVKLWMFFNMTPFRIYHWTNTVSEQCIVAFIYSFCFAVVQVSSGSNRCRSVFEEYCLVASIHGAVVNWHCPTGWYPFHRGVCETYIKYMY